MIKHIKQIPRSNYRPIILSLVISVAYLFTPMFQWLSRDEALLTSIIFFFVAVIMFLASLCDSLKMELDNKKKYILKDGKFVDTITQ